jgi:glucose-1-phosphate thymidylyltransferase
MKAIILAAGYATRLYPLTRDRPKPLLTVGGRSILEHILSKLAVLPELDEVLLVTNHRFHTDFASLPYPHLLDQPVRCLDDGSTENQNRLGALRDLQLAVDSLASRDDALVLAGDNLFNFALADFTAFFRTVGHDCISTHRLADPAALRRTGVIERAADGRVLSFEEKPAHPRADWAVPPFYIYRRDTLPLLDDYLRTGGNPDAPGHFIPWLLQRRPVYAWAFQGRRWDIGDLASYHQACQDYPEDQPPAAPAPA